MKAGSFARGRMENKFLNQDLQDCDTGLPGLPKFPPQAFICPKGAAFPIFLSSHLLSFPLFHYSDEKKKKK